MRVNTHGATHSGEAAVAFTAVGSLLTGGRRHFTLAFTEPLSGVFHLYLVIFLASGCYHTRKSLVVVLFMTLTDLLQDGKE